MKLKITILTTFVFLLSFVAYCQVGIGTTNPKGALDITSASNGVLIPRVALTSAKDILTVINPNGGALVNGTLVYNTGTSTLTTEGFLYWNGTNWTQLINNSPSVYTGKAIISATGTMIISGLPFQPRNITFTGYANVNSYTLNSDNGVGDNNSGIVNSFGYMTGFANNYGAISQQVICGGGSGNSINDISRYASAANCIGIRYANQNGDSLGVTSAALTSFNPDGFTLNVNSFASTLVVLYVAYKY